MGGAFAVAGWFLLPWVDIVLRVRSMRLPISKQLQYRPPPTQDEFPALRETSVAFEDTGFERVEDTGWEGGEVRQFLRLFYLQEKRVQGAISFNQQHGMGFGFISFTTRTKDGRVFITTDNPYSNLPQPPDIFVYSVRNAASVTDLMEEHLSLLDTSGVDIANNVDEIDPEHLPQLMSGELQQQIRHNLRTGYIKDAGEGKFRYSWRGCFYLWGRVLRDMVRLA